MNKKQARAILRLHDQIQAACDQAEQSLQGWDRLENAKAYWLGHLRNMRYGYAAIPVDEAMKVLDL